MRTVLVVDDSQVDRRLVGGLLTRSGEYEVVYAEDGRDGLQRIELDMPDIVLTDLHMPELNGLELVEAIKAEFPLIPVVLMTAQGGEELAVEALRRGAAGYVTKRRVADDLISTLERVFEATSVDHGQTRLQARIVKSETIYELPNDTALVQAMVQRIREMLGAMRAFQENDRLRIGIALEESLLNGMYHGNLEVCSELRNEDHQAYENLARERAGLVPYMHRRLDVDVRLNGTEARFIVRDEGPGFDPESLPDATDPDFLERPSGRGVLLMRSFMDEVSFNTIGNEVTLVKRVSPPESESIFDD